jgi:hypothetical protein
MGLLLSMLKIFRNVSEDSELLTERSDTATQDMVDGYPYVTAKVSLVT